MDLNWGLKAVFWGSKVFGQHWSDKKRQTKICIDLWKLAIACRDPKLRCCWHVAHRPVSSAVPWASCGDFALPHEFKSSAKKSVETIEDTSNWRLYSRCFSVKGQRESVRGFWGSWSIALFALFPLFGRTRPYTAVHGRTQPYTARTQPYGHSKAATPARPAEKSSDLSTLLSTRSTRSTRSTGSTRSTRRHSQILRLFSDSCEEASVTLQHEKVFWTIWNQTKILGAACLLELFSLSQKAKKSANGFWWLVWLGSWVFRIL